MLCVTKLKQLNTVFSSALACALCGGILRLACLAYLVLLSLLTLLVFSFLSCLMLLRLPFRSIVT